MYQFGNDIGKIRSQRYQGKTGPASWKRPHGITVIYSPCITAVLAGARSVVWAGDR